MTVLYAANYSDVAGFMGKARDFEKGRPAGTSGCRWKPTSTDSFVLMHGTTPIVTYNPDNTAVFHVSPLVSHWAVGSLALLTPFMLTEGAPKRVKFVRGNDELRPQVYDGLMADLTTGKFINPLPDLKDRVDKKQQAVWLKKRRDFLTHVKTLARIGALDTYNFHINPARNPHRTLDILYHMIHDGSRDAVTMDLLLYSVLPPWGPSLRGMEIYDKVESAVKNHSLALRMRMGVFHEGEQ
jgi:hypothetical protein